MHLSRCLWEPITQLGRQRLMGRACDSDEHLQSGNLRGWRVSPTCETRLRCIQDVVRATGNGTEH